MVALATTLTNQKTERRIANAKQTTNRGHEKRVNKTPLIALTTYRPHVKFITYKTDQIQK